MIFTKETENIKFLATKSCQSLESFLFSSMNISVVPVIGKVTRVKMEYGELKEQENLAPPSGSSLNVTLQANEFSRRLFYFNKELLELCRTMLKECLRPAES